MLAVGATDGTVNLWDVRSRRKIESFRAVPGIVAAVSFGAGGQSLPVAADSSTQPGLGGHSYLRVWGL
jgi:hypothetical protein